MPTFLIRKVGVEIFFNFQDGAVFAMKTITNKNILIVEDSKSLRNELFDYFSVSNTVHTAKTLAEATEEIRQHEFDIILLDLILPDGSGLSLFNERGEGTPVVILSDLGSDNNILQGFEYGAADYIVKPASAKIIEARMALRLLPPKEAVFSLHGLTVDMRKRTAVYNNRPLDLTSSEFNILTFLMQNAGNYYSAVDIYEAVWKMPHLNTQTIRIHLHNLRKKMIQMSEECGELIITEFGKGYTFRRGS